MKLSEMSCQTDEKRANKQKDKEKQIEDEFNELKNCSSDQLMEKLAQEVKKQKLNGQFDYEALKNSIEQIKIYLPTQTYENMLRIIESLK